MKTRPMLTLADCRKIGEAAEAEARNNNWPVTIAILDDGGIPLYLFRMDGANAVSPEIAVMKGRTAALSGRPSKFYEDRIKDGRVALLSFPLVPVQGGLPIVVEGQRVGGVGVSGVQSHEDEQIAAAGIAALGI